MTVSASNPSPRLRVLLLFGGRSAEHDVSRVTAVAVARALDPERYEVIPVAIAKDGRWLFAHEARAALEAGPESLPDAFVVGGEPVTQLADPTSPHLVPLKRGIDVSGSTDIDVVFPLLHGPYGEDGTVQGLFELAGLAYVGSGVLGSAVAMDKVMAKRAFAGAGVPSVSWVAHRDGEDRAELADRVGTELGYPCFVKPANMGSSIGVTKVTDPAGLPGALDEAASFDEWVLVEEAVTGREIEVAVLGDRPPEPSLPGEIVPGADFYTYTDKYEDGRAELRVPAPLPAERVEEVRTLAVQAFESCRCEAMARVDFFFEERGRDGTTGRGFLVNEVNTIPGFTPISMYPKLWEATGVPYPELLDRLIAMALDRRARRERRAGRQRG